MEQRGWKSTAAYIALLASAFVLAVVSSYLFGPQMDNFAYDQLIERLPPKPWTPRAVILAIDEKTLAKSGGLEHIREPLAQSLRLVAAAKPKAVAVDVILADNKPELQPDRDLAQALCSVPNLVLSAEIVDGAFEYPLPQFRRCAAAIGHVYTFQDLSDSRTRVLPLDRQAGRQRLWALALEAFRLSRGVPVIQESRDELDVGSAVLPVPKTVWYNGPRFSKRELDARLMRIEFDPTPIPRVSMQGLVENPALSSQFTGKVVFVGLTAVAELRDRLFTPHDPWLPVPGIEINAESFETMDHGLFLTDVSFVPTLGFSLLLLIAAGLSFRYLPGLWAYIGGLTVLAATVVVPYLCFGAGRVLAVSTPFFVAWFGVLTAAGYYYFVVRRNWRIEQASRTRYQQAMQFVTHEMRTPLSAIQGSSELISRYALTEDKRKQIANLINSESKRLARMVEVFLSVERLSAGQIELKRELINVRDMVELCSGRARPLADRKHIGINLGPIDPALQFTGDHELIEYACYNLLTNAIKYSPRETQVTVSALKQDGFVRIAVLDQGIGMDQKEVKQIFQKFYRTKKAEQSGEAGTGIGLSIVQQIVEQHGGQIEVASQPGVGSCFTLVMPAAVSAPAAAERH